MSYSEHDLVEARVETPAVELPRRRQLTSVGAVVQSVWAKVIIVGLNAATGIIAARGLEPVGRGELTAMILWPVFLGSALTLGIPSALTFQMRKHPGKLSELVGVSLLIGLLASCLAIVIGAVLLPTWIGQYSPETIWYGRLFLLSCPLTSLALVGRAALEGAGNFAGSNKLLLASPALTVIWLAVLWATKTITPVTAAFAYVVVGILPVGVMFGLLWKEFSPSLRHLHGTARMLFSYGLRSYGIDLCGAMALYVDQALVVRVLSPTTMGIYVVALSLSRMLNAFHMSVVMVLFPKAVSQRAEIVREMTGRAVRMSTLLTTTAGVGIMLIGPQALTLLYGKEYSGAIAVLNILVIEVILAGVTVVLSQAFMALGRPGVITTLQVSGLLLTVPLVLVLAPRLGIVGAGLALLISTAARLTFVLVSFPVFLKMPIPAVLPGMSDLRYIRSIFVARFRRQIA